MPKYRKKPVVIDAREYTAEDFDSICEWIGEHNLNDGTNPDEGYIGIVTPEGDMTARKGDYIIKGVKGEFYPCKPDIFLETYEEEYDTKYNIGDIVEFYNGDVVQGRIVGFEPEDGTYLSYLIREIGDFSDEPWYVAENENQCEDYYIIKNIEVR